MILKLLIFIPFLSKISRFVAYLLKTPKSQYGGLLNFRENLSAVAYKGVAYKTRTLGNVRKLRRVFLPFAIVSLKFVVLMIKTTFLGHFLRDTLTHSQTHSLTDSQTHSLTHGKVFLQSCIAAAKKLVGHFLNFLL